MLKLPKKKWLVVLASLFFGLPIVGVGILAFLFGVVAPYMDLWKDYRELQQSEAEVVARAKRHAERTYEPEKKYHREPIPYAFHELLGPRIVADTPQYCMPYKRTLYYYKGNICFEYSYPSGWHNIHVLDEPAEKVCKRDEVAAGASPEEEARALKAYQKYCKIDWWNREIVAKELDDPSYDYSEPLP